MGASETEIVINLLEQRIRFAFPPTLRQLYFDDKGTHFQAVRLLSLREINIALDNWPRYGFEDGFLPFVEDEAGDLFCLRCIPPHQGHVFHLRWTGQSIDRYADMNQFIGAAFNTHAD